MVKLLEAKNCKVIFSDTQLKAFIITGNKLLDVVIEKYEAEYLTKLLYNCRNKKLDFGDNFINGKYDILHTIDTDDRILYTLQRDNLYYILNYNKKKRGYS